MIQIIKGLYKQEKVLILIYLYIILSPLFSYIVKFDVLVVISWFFTIPTIPFFYFKIDNINIEYDFIYSFIYLSIYFFIYLFIYIMSRIFIKKNILYQRRLFFFSMFIYLLINGYLIEFDKLGKLIYGTYYIFNLPIILVYLFDVEHIHKKFNFFKKK